MEEYDNQVLEYSSTSNIENQNDSRDTAVEDAKNNPYHHEQSNTTNKDSTTTTTNLNNNTTKSYNARKNIDDKYAIALDESRFTAYQQAVVPGKGSAAIVAFFAVSIKTIMEETNPTTETENNEIQSTHFQHGDVLKNHIFLVAVSMESLSHDIQLVFVKKGCFYELYDQLVLAGQAISSNSMFDKG